MLLLITDFSLFWNTGGASILHDTDQEFTRLLDDCGLISVVRGSIVSLEDKKITLSSGQTYPSDAVVFATGWRAGVSSIFDRSTAADLGLSSPHDELSAEETDYWRNLDREADRSVLSLYPIFKQPPPGAPVQERLSSTPYRLFRGMVPTKLAAQHDRSVIFLGMLVNACVATHSEVTGLWSVAYLEGLPYLGSTRDQLNDKLAMDKDVAHMMAFMSRRYPNTGNNSPSAALEIRSFIDVMLSDLGLKWNRKQAKTSNEMAGFLGIKAWRKEWFVPYVAADYAGIIDEYLGNIQAK